ncbi:CDP-diacylglycerol--glycerol-3-phosphate 3-phosphatidyltransferase [Gammaproteobacteria bacterium]|jgi:CDP-diacylglycerol--glycerol-3-phosphate 3-phosphatidyltransferase|nr:CDP-diacylglycerol--glycerol-3-phosphate 3-phosphatidyltransferase [Gammaproteobacteria bacterium]MDB9947892.1 CDP-diacylglycerol--glycerol-3-phosphate 3-phosphatidyltransferase [Gammaproteobacteria bacterium]|tara:strand:- start:861 stop:1403 length:543 start_codon:yes stop_codon:yes gene_type:complete
MKNIINLLTFSRILSAPILFFLIVSFQAYGFAVLVFVLASISDYLDGFLARKYNLASVLGEILDPIADKILVVFTLIGLSINLQSVFIGALTGIVLAREFWVSALRDFNARVGNTNATKATFLAKIKTTLQMIAISFYLVSLYLNNAFLFFMSDFILLLAMIVTLKTGISYTIASLKQVD